jgi:hypothetical protein
MKEIIKSLSQDIIGNTNEQSILYTYMFLFGLLIGVISALFFISE